MQPKEQVLLLGWGVPMPLPVKSRRYNDSFWMDMLGGPGGNGHKRRKEQNLKELGF